MGGTMQPSCVQQDDTESTESVSISRTHGEWLQPISPMVLLPAATMFTPDATAQHDQTYLAKSLTDAGGAYRPLEEIWSYSDFVQNAPKSLSVLNSPRFQFGEASPTSHPKHFHNPRKYHL